MKHTLQLLELSLLATNKRWLSPHELYTSQNGEPKSCRILSEHDIYVGKETIRAQCESLSAMYQPETFHDARALQLILEACTKIT